MPISLHLQDNYYPFEGVDHQRDIARAFVVDENGLVALHHLHRDDIFGNQYYYETPGGGVDKGETFEEAVIRECEDEIGYRVEVRAYLGEVIDYYNLIKRENHNRFYLCRKKGYVGKHFASKGDLYIAETIWVPIEKVIELYEAQEDNGVAGIVKQRELPIAMEAMKRLKTI